MSQTGESRRSNFIPNWALALLRCPCTEEPLLVASAEWIQKLAEKQAAGKLESTLGIKVEERVEAGLVNQNETHFHLVRNGIPTLLPSEAIELDSL